MPWNPTRSRLERISKRVKRKRNDSRRAISEIIASLLMILVVVSLSAVIFGFASNGFNNMGANFSNLFGNAGNSLSERIVVEQVTFNETGSALGANIYVRNAGINPSNVAAVYVTNLTSSSFVRASTLTPNKQINGGSFLMLTITFTPDRGSTYLFTVATALGNTITVNAKA